MIDPRLSGMGRYATLRLLFGALMAGPLPTVYLLGIKGPETFQDWYALISTPVLLVLGFVWIVCSILGVTARRLPASAGPLRRLQEWDDMEDGPATAYPPRPAAHAAWRNSLAGRLVRAWGGPMPSRRRSLLAAASFIVLALWLALFFTVWTENAAATRFWSSTGLAAWQLLVVAAAVLTAIYVKQWALRTGEAVRGLTSAPG